MQERYERAREYLEQQSSAGADVQKKCAPTLTLSREAGAGADAVSARVISLLAENGHTFTLFNKKLIGKIVMDENLPDKVVDFLSDDSSTDQRTLMQRLFGKPNHDSDVIKHTVQVIYKMARAGNVVIIGRGGSVIAADLDNVLHVRLVAPLEIRLRYIQEYFKIGRREAEDYVKEQERSRKAFVANHFGKDIDDPLGYHLVLNTHLLGFERSARIIAEELRKLCR